MYGPAARASRAVHLRLWGTDPFTRGYVTQWWPGDVMRVGPLHGTHDPPFYVCGSDQWVAGYMEGAVRTGRAAAAAALAARLRRCAGAGSGAGDGVSTRTASGGRCSVTGVPSS